MTGQPPRSVQLLPLLVLLFWCSLLTDSSSSIQLNRRSDNNLTLSCWTSSDRQENARWWFNETVISNTSCYGHVTPDEWEIFLRVTPQCEGYLWCGPQQGNLPLNITAAWPLYGEHNTHDCYCCCCLYCWCPI